MNQDRRDFLKTTLASCTSVALPPIFSDHLNRSAEEQESRLLDNLLCGDLEVAPIVFDDSMINLPLLHLPSLHYDLYLQGKDKEERADR